MIVKFGEGRGDVGESRSEEVLEAGVTLLFLLGLSGVKNRGSVGRGGHDWGRDKAPGRGEAKHGETVLPRFSNMR